MRERSNFPSFEEVVCYIIIVMFREINPLSALVDFVKNLYVGTLVSLGPVLSFFSKVGEIVGQIISNLRDNFMF